jgi:hypothetical protein
LDRDVAAVAAAPSLLFVNKLPTIDVDDEVDGKRGMVVGTAPVAELVVVVVDAVDEVDDKGPPSCSRSLIGGKIKKSRKKSLLDFGATAPFCRQKEISFRFKFNQIRNLSKFTEPCIKSDFARGLNSKKSSLGDSLELP